MILDERCEFADAVSVAAVASTALIGDVYNLQDVRDIGAGYPLYFMITTATEIITAGTAGTIRFQLVSDAQAAIATDGSATVHYDTGTLVTDDAAANDARLNAAGVICQVALPAEGAVYEQYLGVLCIIAGQTVTAGAINAFLTPDQHAWKAYADAET
jgi:hypothetical protein